MKPKFKINQSVKVFNDMFEGIITGITLHNTGCIKYCVCRNNNGELKEEWFGEPDLKESKTKTTVIEYFEPQLNFHDIVIPVYNKKFKLYVKTMTLYTPGYWRYGCFLIDPPKDKSIDELYYYDENELKLIKSTVTKLKEDNIKYGPPRMEAR